MNENLCPYCHFNDRKFMARMLHFTFMATRAHIYVILDNAVALRFTVQDMNEQDFRFQLVCPRCRSLIHRRQHIMCHDQRCRYYVNRTTLANNLSAHYLKNDSAAQLRFSEVNTVVENLLGPTIDTLEAPLLLARIDDELEKRLIALTPLAYAALYNELSTSWGKHQRRLRRLRTQLGRSNFTLKIEL